MAVRTNTLFVVAALLGGCASMDADSCRQADGYDLGWRDARFKVQSRGSVYAQQCGSFDLAAYEKGYREGRWEYPDRTP